MNELTDALSKLPIGEGEDDGDLHDVSNNLSIIIKYISIKEPDPISHVELLLENGVLDSILYVLKSREKFCESTIIKVLKIVAELAKTTMGRKMCCDLSLIDQIVYLLESKNSDVVLQACRALGNICYDNEDAHILMKEKKYIGRVLQLFKAQMDGGYLLTSLANVTSGCLLNLMYTDEEIQKQALVSGILDVLFLYLTKFYADEVAVHCIAILSCLAESDVGKRELLESLLMPLLLKFLEEPTSDDILDSLLETFGNLCENDSAKFKLAEMGLCHKLVELVKKHLNGESCVTCEKSVHVFKTVPELVILVLTGDSSMEFLYDKGEGLVYKEISSWIKIHNDNLCIAGALALGNFARKDSHCAQMISSGIGKNLLTLLQKHSGGEGDIKMQHAILSALRNLAVPACNKSPLVELGVVDQLLSMMNIETYPIVFKLLGTLRMLLDKQEQVAIEIGGNASFIKRLVQWSSTNNHLGVKGEATRILAWLVKISHSTSVMKKLIDENALPHIVSMLKSEHVIMQNEALIALTLMAKCCTGDFEKEAENSDLWDEVVNVLTKNSHVSEVTQNTLTFVSILMESEKMSYLMSQTELRIKLEALKSSDENVVEKKQQILLQLEKSCS